MKEENISVVYFQRKPFPNFNFSVEIIFDTVRKYLPASMKYSVFISKFYSQGLFTRIYNVFEAFFNQGQINHVTGDISYIGILLNKNKTIHTILDCVFLTNSKGIKRSILKLFWLQIPVKKSKFVTTISEASKKDIINNTQCSPNKVIVIPIALAPIFTFENRAYNWHKPRLLMIGSAPNKNTARMIEAIKNVDCEVVVVAEFNEGISSTLKQNKINYTYRHGLSQAEIKEVYKQTDILLFCSTFEGFGMPIIEAQAMGTAVITSNISSMPEVATATSALLVNPYQTKEIEQAVNLLINNKNKREELIAEGFKNIERFKPSTISKMYYNLYELI